MGGASTPEQREGPDRGRSEDTGGSSVSRPGRAASVVAKGPLDAIEEWFFLVGDRLAVAGVLLLGALVVLSAVNATTALVNPAQPIPLFYAFDGLIGGNFTLITIVISVNQLVVSQQIGAPGELRDQIESTNAYREAVEASVDVPVAPVTPSEFLHLLLRSTADAVESIHDEIGSVPDGTPTDDLLVVTGGVYGHAAHVETLLTRSGVSAFQALAAALDTNYSKEMYRLRQLRYENDEHYPDEVVECLDDLVVRLQQIDVARQYLKTIYVQDELSRLSRTLLYVGVPAVLTAVVALRALAAPVDVVTPGLIRTGLPLALTVSMAPLAVLFAYVVRLSTVAQRTVAITPFTTPTQERL